MKFSIATIILSLTALSSAGVVVRQNGARPVATGSCCVANTSLKQDACKTAGGAAGRCVPGGGGANCEFPSHPLRITQWRTFYAMHVMFWRWSVGLTILGNGALDCVAQTNL